MLKHTRNDRPWWVIDPRSSAALKWWDLVSCFALFFTATVTPFEIGFLSPPTSWQDWLFIVNRVIDTLFFMDICCHFCLMYPTSDAEQSVVWESKPSKIALHYLKSWFIIDAASSLVSIVDFIAVSGGSDQSEPASLLLTTHPRDPRPPSPWLALAPHIRLLPDFAHIPGHRPRPARAQSTWRRALKIPRRLRRATTCGCFASSAPSV